MKKYFISTLIFFAAITSVIVYYSCSKVIVTETCFDKIKNNGETDVDCGGPCKTCAAAPSGPVIPPCTPPANTMNFNSQNFSLSSYSSSSSGQFEITGNASGADIRLTFLNQPTVDKVYAINTSPFCSSVGPNECCLVITAFNQYNAQSGSVYVNIVGGNMVVTFCSIPLSSGLFVTGNMTCP